MTGARTRTSRRSSRTATLPFSRTRENRGKGKAILTGLRYVEDRGGRFMVTIDADGQHYPRDLEKFIPLLQDDETAIVIGSRKFEGENVPRASAFGRRFAQFLAAARGRRLHR